MIGARWRALWRRMRKALRSERGQMTVEIATVLPVAIIVMAIVCNGMTFFSECAAFDRMARNAVRLYATVPAYGEGPEQAQANIETLLESRFAAPGQEVTVTSAGQSGYTCYTATLSFAPTLFGMSLRQEFFGVHLPRIDHSTSLTVDRYKPGMLL